MTRMIDKNIWLQYWRPRAQTRLRLFCFPYAGGSASIYRSWFDALPAQVEICPVQLPGRENRLLEEPFTGLAPLVETLAQVLFPYFTLPYAFFGHSMGAIISFELARFIRYHLPLAGPLHLYVSGHRAPQMPDPAPPTYHLAEPLFMNRLRQLQGTPEEILQNEELLQLLLPSLRADFEISETYHYVPGKPLPCPITAFGGQRDDEAPLSSMVGWARQTSQAYTFHSFAGGHFFFQEEQRSFLTILHQALLTDIQVIESPVILSI